MSVLKRAFCCSIVLAAAFAAAPAKAGDVDIVDAKARKTANGWSFSVTLEHGDTGWDHYADLWQVYTPDGKLLGERVLLHPHVQEQPFIRSLSGVVVPEGVNEVIIRARDSVHGTSPQEYRLSLTAE
ncbi:MAG: hypothetical protein JJ866_14620 [Roseibium sp.]|uniref:hypothetical protein n=1 Tax=Roseibium sp. TaxID=1936156 RepID=UPI001B246410|nr:hypothetical protein [Roseibium sp.]MBO6893173.1 hypothetical protein [Roseibium sp.]MBO6933012.1 hypothetical protein [Roseibium sp.]